MTLRRPRSSSINWWNTQKGRTLLLEQQVRGGFRNPTTEA